MISAPCWLSAKWSNLLYYQIFLNISHHNYVNSIFLCRFVRAKFRRISVESNIFVRLLLFTNCISGLAQHADFLPDVCQGGDFLTVCLTQMFSIKNCDILQQCSLKQQFHSPVMHFLDLFLLYYIFTVVLRAFVCIPFFSATNSLCGLSLSWPPSYAAAAILQGSGRLPFH